MSKLPHPYNWYYKSMRIEDTCPFCKSDGLQTSDDHDVIWCSGYEDGGYVSIHACETYAEDAQKSESTHCLYCSSADFSNRKIVKDKLVIICESCMKAVDFKELKVTDLLF